MASTWSCVTNTEVVGTRWRSSLISRRICARSWASRLDRGSSNRNTFGLRTMQRPSATRCCWPPESWRGRRSSSGSIDSTLAAPRTAASMSDSLHAAVAQAERQVVVHAHVLVERVVLEHHGDVAVLRLQAVDDAIADGDGAAGDVLQAGDHAQRRGLAAARRPDQHDELVVGDMQVEVLHGDDAAG